MTADLGGIFKSNAGVASVDIMKPDLKSGENKTFGNFSKNSSDFNELFSRMSAGPTYVTASADMQYEPQAKSSYESVFVDPEPDRSVFDDLDAGNNVDRSPPAVVAQDLMLDSNKPAPEAEKTHDKTVSAKEEVSEKMNMCVQDWDAHQCRAADYLKEAAECKGMNGNDVAGEFLPKESKDKASAAIAIGSQLATSGGGSFITALGAGGNVAYGAEKIAEQRKDLTVDQKKALIEDTCKIAQSKAPPDTRASASVSSKAGGYTPDAVDANLAKLSEAKMEKLLTQTVEQQPEFQALAQMDHDLDVVLDNHKEFEENYGKNNVYDKTLSLAAADNKVAEKIIVEAQTIQVSTVAANDPSFDATHALLTGESVSGALKVPEIPKGSIDLKSVATMVSMPAFAAKEAVAANELYMYAKHAMAS